MAISKVNPVSTSTEGIVTVKIAATTSEKTLPVPFTAGNYRIDTGASGTIRVILLKSDNSIELDFSFATSSFFTIANTVTKVQVLATTAAINGIISVQQLNRGVVSDSLTAWTYTTSGTGDFNKYGRMVHNAAETNYYIVGGVDATGAWDQQSGSGTVRKWVKATNTWSTIISGNSNLNWEIDGRVVNNVLYFARSTNQVGDGSFWYKFDPATETISGLTTPTNPIRLSGLTKNNANTKIYAFGSYQHANAHAARVYDIAANTWTSLLNMPFTVEAYGGGDTWADPNDSDKIYIASQTGQTTVWRYNIAANTYTNLGFANLGSMYDGQGALSPGGYYITPQLNTAREATAFPTKVNFSYYSGTPTAISSSLNNLYTQSPDGGAVNNFFTNCEVYFDSTNIYCHGGANTGRGIYYAPIANVLGKSGLS